MDPAASRVVGRRRRARSSPSMNAPVPMHSAGLVAAIAATLPGAVWPPLDALDGKLPTGATHLEAPPPTSWRSPPSLNRCGRASARSSCCSARTAPKRRTMLGRSGKMPTTSMRRGGLAVEPFAAGVRPRLVPGSRSPCPYRPKRRRVCRAVCALRRRRYRSSASHLCRVVASIAGASSWTRWPASGTSCNRAPGIASTRA